MRRWYVVMGLLLSSSAYAGGEAIAYVKTVSGTASVTTRNQQNNAQVGTPIFEGSVLKTGPKSSLGVTFKDDTVMSFGADTELTVDEYLFAPSQGKLKLGSTLAKGSMNYISGAIAKLQPKSVAVTTPSGTIGIRGTQFAVKVDNDE